MMAGELCTDGRFEVINEYKQKLIDGTNIETSPEEMKVLDSILFRFWQMGWMDSIEEQIKKLPNHKLQKLKVFISQEQDNRKREELRHKYLYKYFFHNRNTRTYLYITNIYTIDRIEACMFSSSSSSILNPAKKGFINSDYLDSCIEISQDEFRKALKEKKKECLEEIDKAFGFLP